VVGVFGFVLSLVCVTLTHPSSPVEMDNRSGRGLVLPEPIGAGGTWSLPGGLSFWINLGFCCSLSSNLLLSLLCHGLKGGPFP
jgi:hypothetical protein